jgi:hypothetical protein
MNRPLLLARIACGLLLASIACTLAVQLEAAALLGVAAVAFGIEAEAAL